MILSSWASRWGIPPAALDDLRRQFGMIATPPPVAVTGPGEASVLSRVRIEASIKGIRLWRNNLGAVVDSRGNYIRYGLANDSPKLNEQIKSSDLIGIRPGGQFVAREIKAPGWCYRGTAREKAQLNFLELIAGLGGDAQFATGEGTL